MTRTTRHVLLTAWLIASTPAAWAQANLPAASPTPAPTSAPAPAPSTPPALIAPAQAPVDTADEGATAEADISRVHTLWKARLEALRPQNPEAYFLLAEEVADAARNDPASRQLAARLFVIAMNLDLARNAARPSLAASACVALADIDPSGGESTWLLSLAQRFDPRQVRPDWLAQPASAAPDSVPFRIATAMGMIRAGEGIQAKRVLSDRAVEPSFRALDRTLRRMTTLSTRDLLREANRWPCPECANQRVVKRPGVTPIEYRVCSTCGGTPGPELTGTQLIEHLRVESFLLDVGQRSWGAQTLVDSGAPIVDPEPGAVAKAFGIDPAQTLFRDGKWIAPPGTAAPSPRATTPATPQPATPSSPDPNSAPAPGVGQPQGPPPQPSQP